MRHVVPRKKYEDYEWKNPYVGRWKPKRGFADAEHFRFLLDLMEHCHVTWRSYEHRRDVTPFSRRVLVLQMGHGRQPKDGVSLAGAGSEAVRICLDPSLISYYDSAFCPIRCGCCLLGVCSTRR